MKLLTYLLSTICFSILILPIEPKTFVDGSKEADRFCVDSCKSAVLMDYDTGKILYELNPNEAKNPASMTKIMSATLILEAIHENRLHYEDLITVSEYAHSMGGSQVYLSTSEKMSVRDLFKCMMIASANDATVALAEAVAGSVDLFVAKMNKYANALGLYHTHFTNPTGLPAENHYTSSIDLAIIARNLIKKYGDEILPITNTFDDYIRKDTDHPFWLVNTNKLIKEEDIDGLKTGWTNEAGYCLCATAKRGNRRLISVVMGSDTVQNRSKDTLKLLNYGFANFENHLLVSKDDTVLTSESIFYLPEHINYKPKEDVYLTLPKGEKLGEIVFEISDKENEKILKILRDNIEVAIVPLKNMEEPIKKTFIQVFFDIIKNSI